MSETFLKPSACPGINLADLESLRAREYARLDAQSHVYLDYTGGGLHAASQVREHTALLERCLLGNPHSTNPTSTAASEFSHCARQSVLEFFNASPDDYTVVFTANATGALKLVGEAYPFDVGSRFALTADNHNSVNGIREFARARSTPVSYVPVVGPELRVDTDCLRAALNANAPRSSSLFAYPAQSNVSGVQHPLEWIGLARERGWDVLLDASAFAPTNRVDVDRWQPDFVCLSFYKLFGYPTGHRLPDRPPIRPGSTAAAVVFRWHHRHRVGEPRRARDAYRRGGLRRRHHQLPGSAGGRDGPALPGQRRHRRGAPASAGAHRLAPRRHDIATPRQRCSARADLRSNYSGSAWRHRDVQSPDAGGRGGGLSPGGEGRRRVEHFLARWMLLQSRASEAALGLTPAMLARVFDCDRNAEGGRRRHEWGMVRASLGIASTPADIRRFIEFLSHASQVRL